jgi:hypothetical protein
MIVLLVTGKKHRRIRAKVRGPRARNPVRELPISQAERHRLQQEVQKQFSGRGKQLRDAALLYTNFTGHEEVDAIKISIPKMPEVLVEIGYVDYIGYTTVRDHVTERYQHDWKKKARPLLGSSPDGKSLFMLGGAFTFGERGIVDD